MTRGPKTWTAAKPGRAKAKSNKTQAVKADLAAETTIPKELLQKCLEIFKRALWTGPEDIAALQEVKGHLYNRDFLMAFGSEHYLRAYALRWSAARALGYLEVFDEIEAPLLSCRSGDAIKVLAVGGGAGAEVVGFAGWLKHASTAVDATQDQTCNVDLSLVDVAAWQQVADSLAHACTTPVELSKYASAAAREANIPFVPADRLQTRCEQADVLEWDEQTVASRAETMDLVTIMFTLNELYSTSVPKTQRFLSHLTATMRFGSLLLVVDSPGSYSTVSINGAEKKYPMQWLLDHTLVGPKTDEDRAKKWEKLVENESKWFRLPEALQYPVELENMRYQIHLYRRSDIPAG